MGFFGDAWDYTKDAYNSWDKSAWGGYLPGGAGPNDPARTGGEYGGVDRNNFNLPGYDDMQARYGGYLNQVDQRAAPQIGQFRDAGASSMAGQQRGLADLLMDRAQGRGPSLADMQMKRGFDQANQAQMSMMAGARPGNAAMAMRLGSQNMAANDMDLTGQGAYARAAEANAAANSLGGVLASGRSADENLNMFNAGQQNQRQSQNAQLQQNQYGIDDNARAGLLGGSFGAAQAQQQGGMNYEQNRAGRFGAVLGVPTNSEVLMGGVKDALKTGGLG
jgi:hypothetical protein